MLPASFVNFRQCLFDTKRIRCFHALFSSVKPRVLVCATVDIKPCQWEFKNIVRRCWKEHNQTNSPSFLSWFWKCEKQMNLLVNPPYCSRYSSIRETFTRMKQLANARNFPKRDYFMAVPNLWNLKVIKFSGKTFHLEKISRKSTIVFLRKSEFSKLHIWSLKNVLILRPISLVDIFWKKLDF